MDPSISIALNVVGIVSSLVIIASSMRSASAAMMVIGYVFLGLNVFLLVGNVS